MFDISVEEVKRLIDAEQPVWLLDVREPQELAICSLEGAEHIPMLQLFTGAVETEAASDDQIIVFCHHGIRSREAVMYLRMNGYPNAFSMAGGVDAWAARIDPTMNTY